MKSFLRLFLISLIALIPVITCNCGGGKGDHDNSEAENKTIALTVNGMHCGSCKNIIETALKQVDGVVKSEVTLPTSVSVVYNPKKVNVATIKQTIIDAGYQVKN